eukprot:648270-Amphidinium_carterae.1
MLELAILDSRGTKRNTGFWLTLGGSSSCMCTASHSKCAPLAALTCPPAWFPRCKLQRYLPNLEPQLITSELDNRLYRLLSS